MTSRTYIVTTKHERPCSCCLVMTKGWFEVEVGRPDNPRRTRICQDCIDAIDRVRVRRAEKAMEE